MYVSLPGRTGALGNSWSLKVSLNVTGEVGRAAFLPCCFSHPHKNYHGGLMVIWRVKQPYNGTVVFKCASDHVGEQCRASVNYMNKFRLVGNPRNNNISISIGNLTWEDSNRYYCRVELSSGRHDKYETKTGTWLHVSAPPRMVNLSVSFDQRRGYHAVCIAEGEPPPSLVWRDPEDQQQDTLLTGGAMKHQKAAELHYMHQDGRYTCVATNSHGRAEGSIYFFRFKPGSNSSFVYGALWAALGAKTLILLLMVAVATYHGKGIKHWDHCQAGFFNDQNLFKDTSQVCGGAKIYYKKLQETLGLTTPTPLSSFHHQDLPLQIFQAIGPNYFHTNEQLLAHTTQKSY
ncbi:sialic acid-binding Ig-like lectin 15 [Gastrophryne carolinensis]